MPTYSSETTLVVGLLPQLTSVSQKLLWLQPFLTSRPYMASLPRSNVFSSDTLADGLQQLQYQQVKREPEMENIEQQLEDQPTIKTLWFNAAIVV